MPVVQPRKGRAGFQVSGHHPKQASGPRSALCRGDRGERAARGARLCATLRPAGRPRSTPMRGRLRCGQPGGRKARAHAEESRPGGSRPGTAAWAPDGRGRPARLTSAPAAARRPRAGPSRCAALRGGRLADGPAHTVPLGGPSLPTAPAHTRTPQGAPRPTAKPVPVQDGWRILLGILAPSGAVGEAEDVAEKRAIGFGYNPPTGDRQIERVDPATFGRDLGRVLDVATQSLASVWVSDHHMTADRYRLECWTQLTWIAARYPGPLLGTVVMANSYRHPPAAGQDGGVPAGAQRRAPDPGVRGRLGGGRVPRLRLRVPPGAGAHRPDGRRDQGDAGPLERATRPPTGASTTRSRTPTASPARRHPRRS